MIIKIKSIVSHTKAYIKCSEYSVTFKCIILLLKQLGKEGSIS